MKIYIIILKVLLALCHSAAYAEGKESSNKAQDKAKNAAFRLKVAGCYFEASGYQQIAGEYLSGVKKDLAGIRNSKISKEEKDNLIQISEKVYSDKPTSFEDYGAVIFNECAQQKSLAIDNHLVKKCFNDSWLLYAAIDDYTNKVPLKKSIKKHKKCPAHLCKKRKIETKKVIKEVYTKYNGNTYWPVIRYLECTGLKK